MADEYFTELGQHIESGGFYQDARDWYEKKYVYAVIDRAYFILYILLLIALIIVSWSTFTTFLPLKPSKPVPIKIGDQVTQFAVLKPIGNRADRSENPQPEIQKYLLRRFIEAYETYDFRNDWQKLKRNEKFISLTATPETLEDYKSQNSTTNANSPILLYRNTALRSVEVNPATFAIEEIASMGGDSKDNSKRYSATVEFTSLLRTTRGGEKSKWRARISFLYKDIRYDKEEKDFTPMEFKVMSYAADKLE
jgi:type IV secretory pathway component VirB8